MTEGWIKLNRKILQWEWWQDHNTFMLFIYCLLRANFDDQRFMGVEVPRGSFVSSYRNLAKDTGLSERQVRTALEHLKSTHELTQCSYPKFTVFTVVKWDEYQGDRHSERQSSDTEATHERQQYKKERKQEGKNVYIAKPNKFASNMEARNNTNMIANIEDRLSRGEM